MVQEEETAGAGVHHGLSPGTSEKQEGLRDRVDQETREWGEEIREEKWGGSWGLTDRHDGTGFFSEGDERLVPSKA